MFGLLQHNGEDDDNDDNDVDDYCDQNDEVHEGSAIECITTMFELSQNNQNYHCVFKIILIVDTRIIMIFNTSSKSKF